MTIVLLLAACVLTLTSCQKERTCKCEPRSQKEKLQLVTVDRSMKCDAILRLYKERKTDDASGKQTLERYDPVPVSCVDYEEFK